jgi:hypothetical protein
MLQCCLLPCNISSLVFFCYVTHSTSKGSALKIFDRKRNLPTLSSLLPSITQSHIQMKSHEGDVQARNRTRAILDTKSHEGDVWTRNRTKATFKQGIAQMQCSTRNCAKVTSRHQIAQSTTHEKCTKLVKQTQQWNKSCTIREHKIQHFINSALQYISCV